MRGLAAGAVLVLVMALGGMHAAAAAASTNWYGVNATGLARSAADIRQSSPFTDSDAAAVARAWHALDELPINHARVDADWSLVDTAPGQRTWASMDDIAWRLGWSQIGWTPVLVNSPQWESATPGTTNAPPRDLSDFAAFAQSFAERYGPRGVNRYEVWNEPNLSTFWRPAPDPARYGQLFLATRAAIKAVQPDAYVLVGGLAPDGAARFVSAMNAAAPQVLATADGVGYHPYGATVADALGGLRSMHAALQTAGRGSIPIFATEAGWATSGNGSLGAIHLPDSTRAGDLLLLANSLAGSDCHIASFEPFTWYTGPNPAGTDEDGLAMLTPQADDTAESAVFRAMAAIAPPQRSGAAQLPICGARAPSDRKLLRLTMQLHTRRIAKFGCVAGNVSYGGFPLNGIRVEIAPPQPRRGRARTPKPLAVLATDSQGAVAGCSTKFRHRAGRLTAVARVPRAAASLPVGF